jgi:chromosome segregation ATPase
MSGMTKDDYKRRAAGLESELDDCAEANKAFKAQIYKLEADYLDLQHSNEITENELKSLRKQLQMISDWITAAAQ